MVLRKGKFAGQGFGQGSDCLDMSEMMMGERREPKPAGKDSPPTTIPVLQVQDLPCQ